MINCPTCLSSSSSKQISSSLFCSPVFWCTACGTLHTPDHPGQTLVPDSAPIRLRSTDLNVAPAFVPIPERFRHQNTVISLDGNGNNSQ